MGDSYRDAIRKRGKKAKNSRVPGTVTRATADAWAKVRQKHAGVARKTNRKVVAQAPTQIRMF